MSSVAEIIEGPAKTAMKVIQETQQQSLSDSVKQSLDNYFAQLEGQQPSNVFQMVMELVELPMLLKVMEFTGNNQSRAAKLLGISRGTLRKKLKLYDLL
jgi:Fis family transcriptional regulator